MKQVVQDKAEFWQRHIDCAKKSPGGTQKYCLSQSLNVSSFYAWRNKLSRSTKTSASFLPLIVSENIRSQSPQYSASSQLPDAAWAAEFVMHLMQGCR